jgi:hypothetical protein
MRRRTLTPVSRRNAGTNFAGCIMAGAAVVTWAVIWYVAPHVEMSASLAIVAVTVGVCALVAGAALYRRPRPLVPRVNLKSFDKPGKRFVRRVKSRWVTACRDSGVTREERDLDALTIHVPRILSVEPVPLGVKLEVQAVPGQPAEDIAKRSDHLASALGAWLRTEVTGPTMCRVIAELNDPLKGVRRAATSTCTRVIIGRCDDGTEAVLDLSEASHMAIQGMTRTGKSGLCYTIFGQLVESDSVRVTGIDPNRVLLEPLAEATDSDDFVLGADPVAALQLLTESCRVMDERARLLTQWGIPQHEEFSREFRVRIVLLEEYAGLLRQAAAHDEGAKSADKIAPKIKQRVGRLVSEGAKAGIRVVLITQRMDASIVDGDSRGQFGTRITMGVDNGDAVRMLHPQADPETVEKVVAFPIGRCLLWQHRVEKFMQADFTPYDQYRERLGLSPAPKSDLSELDATVR